jgi:Peptidase family M50
VNTPEPDAIRPPLPPFPNVIGGSRARQNVPWNLLAASLAIGVALRLVGPAWVQTFFHSGALSAASDLIALLAALAIAVVLHEGGHLVAALMLDFDVLGGSLGPLRAIRLHGRWTLQFCGSFFSGSVIAIPRPNNATWRTRMLAVVAAGPAATLLSGTAAAAFVISLGASDLWPMRFLSTLAQLSFFIFVLGLFPNASASAARNDARLFCSLLHNTAEAREILLYHLLTQLQVAGVRPRDYPNQIIFKLAHAYGRPEMCLVYAQAIAICALDRGDPVTADAWDKRALDLSEFCNVKHQHSALATSACFDVILRSDLRAAGNKLADLQLELLSPRWFRHRVKAVYWLASGNIHESLAEISRARYAFPNRLPYYDFEQMLLGRLHRIAIETRPRDPAALVGVRR